MGMTLNSNSPSCVQNAVLCMSFSSVSTCQNPQRRSRVEILENHGEPLKESSESSILGRGYASLRVSTFIPCEILRRNEESVLFRCNNHGRRPWACRGLYDASFEHILNHLAGLFPSERWHSSMWLSDWGAVSCINGKFHQASAPQ